MSFFGRADHVLFLSAILWPYLWTALTIFQKLCLLLIHFVERKRTLHLLNKSYLHISKTFHSKRIFFQYLYRIRLEAILDRCIRYVVWWEFQATNFGLEFDAYKNDKNKIWLKSSGISCITNRKKSYLIYFATEKSEIFDKACPKDHKEVDANGLDTHA